MVRFSDLLGDRDDDTWDVSPAPEPTARVAAPLATAPAPSPFAELLGPIATAHDDDTLAQPEPDPVPALEAAFLGRRDVSELSDIEAVQSAITAPSSDEPVAAPAPLDLGIDDDFLPRVTRRRRR
jgi:hypothetical protein